MVETLCRLKQSGTKIYFYKNTNVCYSDYMKNVWNTFMSYVSETLTSTASLSSKRYASAISGVDANSARENASPAQATLMHEISNVDSIPDHGIVLYPTSDIGDVGISKELSQKKFKLFNRRAVTNIYFDEALAKQNL
ncbi:hypothetical protein FACS189449_03580 [Alphaproteobacteria bacterium]|nr:hypothetical protein FACS189449_03580 [Alphaproteobacteria bacterium]